jgi:citrate lyase subunit beta/citryl-CoA lyase
MAERSWLFIPGDSDKKLGKATETGADVIIVDLEDSVALSGKAEARAKTRDWLMAHRLQSAGQSRQGRWVRINALDSGEWWRDDLIAVMAGAPDGIMLPKSAGPEAVQQLSAALDGLEQQNQILSGTTRIMPLVSETAAAALTIAAYAAVPLPRLAGLTWGAEDLSAAIGATRKRHADGRWTDAFRLVRAQTLLTAHASGVAAIDTLHADFADSEGLKRAAQEARADGFGGMLAIHPAQVAVINAAFTPSETELDEARAIVAAFSAEPEAGVLQIERKMIDRPHLKLAQRILGISE